jgi:hypothetical protein
MSTRIRGLIPRGVIAGVIGATALAFWFLVVDGSQAQPFRTPGFLGGALLGREALEPSAAPVLLYTALHYLAFIALGIGLSWSFSKIETIPNLLLGLVLGFALYDLVFYTSVAVTGVDVVGEFGWPVVLVGNLLAAVSLTRYLQYTGGTPPISWWATFADNRVFREGMVAGLIGAGTVALWFLIVDMGRGQPFFTPGALGSALFLGSTEPSSVIVSIATVLGYTVLHVGVFFATGFIAAAIAGYAEDTPPLIIGAVMLFIAFEALFMGLMALRAEFLLSTLAWWAVVVGNILATVAMGSYLWSRHPRLREALARSPMDKTA